MSTTLPTSPLTNLRDLGGIAVHGGVIRTGSLFRADDVALIDEAGASALVDDGIRLVIDLRSPAETALTGRGLLADHAVDYLHLPLTDTVADPGTIALFDAITRAPDPERVMGGWYAALVRERAGELVRGLEAIAETDGGVLFHCAAGKDRTGVFAASVLDVLGADRGDIVADYARTGENLPALLDRLANGRPELAAYAPDASPVPEALLSAPAATMEAMLDDFAEAGILPVLVEGGLTETTIARLRERLVA